MREAIFEVTTGADWYFMRAVEPLLSSMAVLESLASSIPTRQTFTFAVGVPFRSSATPETRSLHKAIVSVERIFISVRFIRQSFSRDRPCDELDVSVQHVLLWQYSLAMGAA